MAQMNQLEAINNVFTGLLKQFKMLSDFYRRLADDPDLEILEEDKMGDINNIADYLLDLCNVIESHLTQPDPTTLTDFVKVCDELQKILPKPVDANNKDGIVKQENS